MARILVVDDERVLRKLISRQLEMAGHEVITAADGVEALKAMHCQDFDVIVSDMKMPVMDGIELLEQCTRLSPTTGFIILTGHGSLEEAVRAFRTGNLSDYLLKPLQDVTALPAVVARAMERRHLRQENLRLVADLKARVRELDATRSQLADLAHQDGLTGLLNHRGIHAKLGAMLAEVGDGVISVILADMDGFRAINDTYGHVVGDQVLRYIATVMRRNCGEDCILGRCGGDEYMAVVPDIDADVAASMAGDVQDDLERHPYRNPAGRELPIHIHFGIADSRTAGTTLSALTAAADSALFDARQSGDTVRLHFDRPSGRDRAKTTYSVLDGLITAIDTKDRYTRRHSEGVAGYAVQLAGAMGLSEGTQDAIRLAGLLHDVGKIGVPDWILRKPGDLTQDEYEVMKSHVTLSALIIHGLPRLNDVLDAVANHHERWDGMGYPKGLSGEDIPLLGRVLAISDAYSAMTIERPYRARMAPEVAIREIDSGAGRQFDPHLAALFTDLIRASDEAQDVAVRLAA